MVVLVINKSRVLAVEWESQPPIPVDPNGPVTCKVSFERMKPPIWQIHVLRCRGSMKTLQLQLQSFGML
jgi:hypothetical protein